MKYLQHFLSSFGFESSPNWTASDPLNNIIKRICLRRVYVRAMNLAGKKLGSGVAAVAVDKPSNGNGCRIFFIDIRYLKPEDGVVYKYTNTGQGGIKVGNKKSKPVEADLAMKEAVHFCQQQPYLDDEMNTNTWQTFESNLKSMIALCQAAIEDKRKSK